MKVKRKVNVEENGEVVLVHVAVWSVGLNLYKKNLRLGGSGREIILQPK